MTALGGALHDPPAVARCLSAAEALLSGDTGGRWVMPDSLRSSSIYKALGTGIASELDLAYWHARYTAASRFDAGGVAADTESSSHQVVPPPEVYFVGLAFHVPAVTEVRASAVLDNNPALRRVLVDVFDLPVGDAGAQRHATRSLPPSSSSGGGEIRFPVLENPLLAVAQSAWLETAVCASAKSWVPHFPPRFGDNEGTMRGSDPGLPPPIRLRCDATRDWSARLFAFAVPNRRALDACKRALDACGVGGGGGQQGGSGGIVEVGAGLGYWKWVLEGLGPFPNGRGGGGGGGGGGGTSRGVSLHLGKAGRTLSGGDAKEAPPLKFLAIDKDPSRVPGGTGVSAASAAAVAGGIDRERERGRGNGNGGRRGGNKRTRREGSRGGRHGEGQSERPTHNEYHGGAPAWAVVEQGGPEQLRALSAAAYPVLLLCYPPPSVGVGTGASGCMGADALARFSGKVLLYIGEVGGDTGSPRFEAALRAGWDLVEEVELPCFSSTANRLMVFARKGAFSSGGGVSASTAGSGKKRKDAGAAAARLDTPGKDACPTGDAGGGGGGAGMAMYRCSGCGAKAAAEGGVLLHRCRLTRSVSFCSEKCLTLDAERWRANLEARHVHLAPGTAVELANQSGKFGGVFRDKKLFKRLA
ncbi:conserved unknown protein [Ectocarpus siliculosus]|uniref:MYND-type domain-containing protein n=1 Tax=Ectocarpus siliculosus TaxID=2880 RepID=D7FW07_ECTSI|nr:conserved unknown protein [Ectocarpus siliculosus]|eukprot:CBJ25527.1 conserved unknown protein [Ectocarpus siliculosus]